MFENSEKGNWIVLNFIKVTGSVTSNEVRSWSLTETCTCDKMSNECNCIWRHKRY